MNDNRGFSLLELLIVVAIILIIATIAIPNLVRSHQAADEAAAVSTLRAINTAEVTYLSSAVGNYGTLGDLVAAGLLDSRFSGASVSGYSFAVTASGSNYTAAAMPTSANSGRYAYFSLPDAVIRYSTATSGCGSTGGTCFPSGMSGQPVQ
ncbi:MAG: pili assembly chaperone [Acidobacteria bacterium]|nr:MAG: pili assembly chaperone [Acidobacteriota bacterium]